MRLRGWQLRLLAFETACCVAVLANGGPLAAKETAKEVYPGKSWDYVGDPAELGWSRAKLEAAQAESRAIGSAGVFVVHRGRVLADWGNTQHRYQVHSIRKSFLSALYGIPEYARKIELDATVGDLGIEDNEPAITAVELQATVRDLLKARSGVYHPALAETESMKRRRPVRGSHAPGTFWYYNNWDFNVLGTVFERQTGSSIFEAFEKSIAQPLEMEDFRRSDTRYERGPDSIHPAYPFRMTARDMARFGLLFARQGRWNRKQVIPASWVEESTTSYSPATSEQGELQGGYSYLWWTELLNLQLPGMELPGGSFTARGAGGHYILVVPSWDLVVVHRMDTDAPNGPRADSHKFGKLVKLLVDAMPASAKPATPPPDPASLALPKRLDALIPGWMAEHHVPGVAVVGLENGRIAWERQYGVKKAGDREPVGHETLFEAASMSKPMAAYAVLKLVEQGKLDLDRPLGEYLPEPYLKDEPRHRKITARMVLSHTTGFPNWRPGGWQAGGPLGVSFEPGSKFGYSGEGFLYLQRVVEKLTGEPFDRYMRRALMSPLQLPNASYSWNERVAELSAAGHDAEGNPMPNRQLFRKPNAAYSLYCSPMEYAQFVVEILRRDRTGDQSLSSKSLAAMFTPTTKARGRAARLGGEPASADSSWFGLGWVIDVLPNGKLIHHSGSNGTGFRCECAFDPDHGSGIVVMTNAIGGRELCHEVIAHGELLGKQESQ